MPDLCVCMRGVISELNSEIEGSHASGALMLFLCSIYVLYFWKKFACGVYLPFWDVVFVCVENEVYEDSVWRVVIECQRNQPPCL